MRFIEDIEMRKQKLIPDKYRFLSGSTIKLIAVLTMLIDHTAGYFVPGGYVLFSIGSHSFMLYSIMRMIGRIAFPLFAFLLVEGFLHTRSRIRYGASLLICAFISEIPWDLVHSGKLMSSGQNVFFTLSIGFLGMCAVEYLKDHPFFQLIALAALAIVSVFIKSDYSIRGFIFIILLYALREHEVLRILPSFILNNFIYTIAAFVPISFYNGKRGFIKGAVLKYAFYAFYPVHLLVFYFIRLANGYY